MITATQTGSTCCRRLAGLIHFLPPNRFVPFISFKLIKAFNITVFHGHFEEETNNILTNNILTCLQLSIWTFFDLPPEIVHKTYTPTHSRSQIYTYVNNIYKCKTVLLIFSETSVPLNRICDEYICTVYMLFQRTTTPWY